MEATVKLDHQLIAYETEHDVHCMLELDVPAADGPKRAPLRIALVVDRSGSMHGPKLAAAKECARFLARRLLPTDELAVIAYDDEVRLVQPLAPVGPDTRKRIGAILARGQTNLSGGWLKGLEELDRATDGVRRVVLLTDGLANVGITNRADLVSLAEGTRARAATTTIGFGKEFDEGLLTAIADTSGGATYFAETPDAAAGIFTEEFEGLTSLVAQNVSVEIRSVAPVELLGVLNNYPAVAVPGGVQVQLGDAYGGERRRLVLRLRVPDLQQLGPARIAELRLRYVTVDSPIAAHETVIPVTVNLVSADEAAAMELDHEVVDEVVLLEAARARDEAMRQADAGDYQAAHDTLSTTGIELLRHAPNSHRAAELIEEAGRLELHAQTLDAANYAMTRKRLSNESWRRSRGRKD
jgi:Ca-activated chloride channel family protein